ncbi:putative treslin [Helianthus annuus]|nr:putative treslin [Helianthus annuus]KAJ0628763.1 putative treslin [Helianthus annuus]KAJ0785088.1 putative treslin [Helianthus annuus]
MRKPSTSMADAIDFSKTHRIVLLIDLNPLLQNPNPNFLTSLLATSKILLSFPSLSSSLFSFKFFFSSLSTLLSASTLHRILPHHSSASLSFNSPSQTLDSLSNTLSSISVSKLPYSPSNCSHTAASLLQLLRGHDWESDFENVSGDGKRRKMKKHMYRELTWSSFCKAAYEFLDVDLAEIYYSYGMQKSKTLKFLKCWMKEVKKHRLSLNNTPPGPCQTGPDLNQQKETDKNKNFAANANYQESDEPFQMHICSDKSRMQDDDALVSCSETSESFFRDLPKKIQHGVESIGVDLKILAERLVSSSLYWLHKKHETMKNLDESCTIEVAEIIKLLLCEPQDMKEHKDYNSSSASEYLVREYELQILLRLEILQSKYVRGMKGSMRMKLVKQICSLLEIIQYLVEGGFHGDLSLYDYVERTIKSRYSKNLGDVIDKIYDQMDLLPFGEENEDQALMINDEDSIQSWREKHERNDMSASKMIQDSLSVEVESCHLLEKVNTSREGQTKEDHARMLNEARERRERARRFAYFTRRMPDLQRVWAPKQSTAMKVKPEPKRKKQMGVSYSVVCETPFGNKPSCPTGQNKSERATPVSKALFQDDR